MSNRKPRGREPLIYTNPEKSVGGTVTVRMSKLRHLQLANVARNMCNVSINEFALQAIEAAMHRTTSGEEASCYEQLRKQVTECLYWFTRDGSPCDGPGFRLAFSRLRELVGHPAATQIAVGDAAVPKSAPAEESKPC
jgi:hypothetical protein